jgi:hypothetical protein
VSIKDAYGALTADVCFVYEECGGRLWRGDEENISDYDTSRFTIRLETTARLKEVI